MAGLPEHRRPCSIASFSSHTVSYHSTPAHHTMHTMSFAFWNVQGALAAQVPTTCEPTLVRKEWKAKDREKPPIAQPSPCVTDRPYSLALGDRLSARMAAAATMALPGRQRLKLTLRILCVCYLMLQQVLARPSPGDDGPVSAGASPFGSGPHQAGPVAARLSHALGLRSPQGAPENQGFTLAFAKAFMMVRRQPGRASLPLRRPALSASAAPGRLRRSW